MKKTMYLIGLLVTLMIVVGLVLLILDSYIIPSDWKEIEIGGFGSVKVPESWEVSVVDGFIYISSDGSGESKNILVQSQSCGYVNKHFAEIEELLWVQDEWLSNGAGIIKYEVRYKDGSSAEIFALEFTRIDTYYESTVFLCLNDSITEGMLKKIANSYVAR